MLTRTEWESRFKGYKDDNASGMRNRKFDKAKVRCYNCDDYGHFLGNVASKERRQCIKQRK